MLNETQMKWTPKKFTPTHIIVILLKLKTRQKSLKAVRNDTFPVGEKQLDYQLISHLKLYNPKRVINDIYQKVKEKSYPSKFLYPIKILFSSKGEIKILRLKKAREFVVSRPIFERMNVS